MLTHGGSAEPRPVLILRGLLFDVVDYQDRQVALLQLQL
jgi:hypothetical protein